MSASCVCFSVAASICRYDKLRAKSHKCDFIVPNRLPTYVEAYAQDLYDRSMECDTCTAACEGPHLLRMTCRSIAQLSACE